MASRRKVVKIAGWPFTFSTTRHCPSPGTGVPASDFSVAGMSGVKPFACVLVGLTCCPLGMASEKDGLPPALGGL